MNSYQQQLAFDKFTKLKVGALFMKMGTGKTKVALDLVKYNNVDLLIYVCPFSAKSNIQDEINKWGVNCDYLVIGYETIQASDNKYLEILEKIKNKKVFIIADESIFIKNEGTKRFKRLLNIREYCEYALILNGTPLTKNEWDLYNQMEFLSHKIIDMSRQEFLNVFFKEITYKKKGHREKTFYKFSEVNAGLLQKMISPYMFECDLDFDKQQYTDYRYIECEPTLYQLEKENKLNEYLENGNSDTIMVMLQILNMIASNAKEKNDALVEYIKGKQVIVYCNYLSEIEYIASKVDCYVINGSVKQRDDIINKFKTDNKPLLMTYGVGSYSLNLQFCDEIVYSSITFDYGKVEQSEYRIKRTGQLNDIKYTYFIADFGINKLIMENLNRKSNLDYLIKEKLKGGIEWLKDI